MRRKYRPLGLESTSARAATTTNYKAQGAAPLTAPECFAALSHLPNQMVCVGISHRVAMKDATKTDH
jgi:hypothetical protein